MLLFIQSPLLAIHVYTSVALGQVLMNCWPSSVLELSSPDLAAISLVLELEGSMPSQTFSKHRIMSQHIHTPIPKSYTFSSTINKWNYKLCYLTVRTLISKVWKYSAQANILSYRNYHSYLVIRWTECKMPREMLQSQWMSTGEN